MHSIKRESASLPVTGMTKSEISKVIPCIHKMTKQKAQVSVYGYVVMKT